MVVGSRVSLAVDIDCGTPQRFLQAAEVGTGQRCLVASAELLHCWRCLPVVW